MGMGETINEVYDGNVWGGSGGSVGEVATSTSMYSEDADFAEQTTGGGNMPVSPQQNPTIINAVVTGLSGNTAMWWIVLLIGLFVLMFLAKHLKADEEKFSAIKPTAYNVLVISLAAILGINFWKAALTMFPIPGLTTLALNA